jgi:hypothetical protein
MLIRTCRQLAFEAYSAPFLVHLWNGQLCSPCYMVCTAFTQINSVGMKYSIKRNDAESRSRLDEVQAYQSMHHMHSILACPPRLMTI